MRLSTSMMYSNGLKGIMSNESELNRLSEQVGSGRRVLTPSDDPLAAALAINVAQTKQMNETFASNRNTAKQNLGLEANVLDSLTTTMQDVMTRVVQAGSTLDDTNRGALATALKSAREAILGLANSTDGNGQFLFSGNAGSTAPYGTDGVYVGAASGDRLVQVDQTRKLSTSDMGNVVFNRANPGSQSYITTADPTNTGTAVFSTTSVKPGSNPTGSSFSIEFATATDGSVTYQIIGTPPTTTPPTTPPAPIGPVPYVPGQAIEMGNGISLSVTGVPANGDKISIARASSDNVDLFKTLDNLIKVLDSPIAGNDTAVANLNNTLSTANKTLSNIYDNLQTVQASVGARLNELDALDATGSQRGLSYAKSLSDLEDLDLIPAASALALRQVALQAAQAAFMAVQGSSLFSRK